MRGDLIDILGPHYLNPIETGKQLALEPSRRGLVEADMKKDVGHELPLVQGGGTVCN